LTGWVRRIVTQLLVLAAAVPLAGCAMAGATAHPALVAAAPGARLVTSRASSHRVQPQPPAGSCHASGGGLDSLPDLHCTPGAIDPAVTQRNLDRTICHPGYSERVRPPESVTEKEKRASLRAYGDRRPAPAYEYDHLVSLELGGARNDPRNLWPEPGTSPNRKDSLENRLHARVCRGEMTLAAAQLAIARNWVAAYRRYVREG
jgi:hypothetical protein